MRHLAFALFLSGCQPPFVPDTPAKGGDSGRDGETAADTGDTGDTGDAGDAGDTGDTSACTDPPVADAGPDQMVDLAAGFVQLDGAAGGGCGPPSYDWAFQSKPAGSALTDGSFDTYTSEDPTFTPDATGHYTVSLAVYDGRQWASPDFVTITVH